MSNKTKELEEDFTLRDAIPGDKCNICKTNISSLQIEQKRYTKYKGFRLIDLGPESDQEQLYLFWSVCYIYVTVVLNKN